MFGGKNRGGLRDGDENRRVHFLFSFSHKALFLVRSCAFHRTSSVLSS